MWWWWLWQLEERRGGMILIKDVYLTSIFAKMALLTLSAVQLSLFNISHQYLPNWHQYLPLIVKQGKCRIKRGESLRGCSCGRARRRRGRFFWNQEDPNRPRRKSISMSPFKERQLKRMNSCLLPFFSMRGGGELGCASNPLYPL